MDKLEFVNVFQGVGKSVTPQENTLFSKWNLLKGKAGNTSPAACLPFGSVACSPYSGGYSSGYGNHKINCKEIPSQFFQGNKIIGFSHFTHSGSGAFGFYYNYLVVSPYVKNLQAVQELKDFDEERAYPGYYSCRLTEENVRCEVTVAEKVALHRYTCESGEAVNLFVDVSNNGLQQNNPKLCGYSTESNIRLHGNGCFGGFITMQGVKIYFYAVCSDPNCKQKICCDGLDITALEFSSNQTDRRFGCKVESQQSTVELKVGFSLVSEMNAMASALTSVVFNAARKVAAESWEEKLNAVELYGISKEDREIFYSNYYHTLVKPCGWNKESFLWREKETFYVDFATLWDVYKTQIPFVFAFYKDVGRGIVKTLVRYGKKHGKLFNALMLSSNMNIESTQACCLGCYVLYDAYTFNLVEDNEIDDMFSVVKAEVGQYREQVLTGSMEKTTKLLDVTLIAAAFSELSKTLGRTQDEEYFSEIAKHWTDAFSDDGLLKENYPYYEGNRWNYSFRFVRDVQKRIALSGEEEKLIKQLDGFFGFTEENELINRFEGFNNETDMETPYFYHYVGEYDKLAKILQECSENCFKNGREGLPGNNDSGGLSACYLWNFLGLYPISGQGQFFIGVPKAEQAVLRLSSGNTLTIRKQGGGMYVERVVFNTEEISGYSLPVSEILKGGELTYYTK